MANEVITAAIALLLLHAFYRAVENQWPESYFPASSSLDRAISGGPVRYGLFRFLPPLLVLAAAASTLRNSGQAVVVPVMAVAVLHSAATSGRAIYDDARGGRLGVRPLVTVYRVLIGVGCLVAGGVSLLVAPLLDNLVPSGREITVSLWTAALAAVLGAYVVTLSRHADGGGDLDAALRASRNSIPSELWRLTESTAIDVGATPRLVQAILLVENIQRPGWVRFLERQGSRFVRRSSCGPLQVASSGRSGGEVDDLVAAIEHRFAGQQVPQRPTYGGQMTEDQDWLQLFLRSYNPDPQWQQDVLEAYWFLQSPRYPTLATSTRTAMDNRPVIELRRLSQDGADLSLSGTCVAYEGNVLVLQGDRHGLLVALTITTADLGGPERGAWDCELELVPEAAGVLITVEVGEGDDPADVSIQVPVQARTP